MLFRKKKKKKDKKRRKDSVSLNPQVQQEGTLENRAREEEKDQVETVGMPHDQGSMGMEEERGSKAVEDMQAITSLEREEKDKNKKKRGLFFFKKRENEDDSSSPPGQEETSEQAPPEQTKTDDVSDDKTFPSPEEEISPERDKQVEVPKKQGLLKRLRQGMSKTRSAITGRLDRLFIGKKEITEELLDELEEILFTSDIGVATTQELIDTLRKQVSRKELKEPEKLKTALKELMSSFLSLPPSTPREPGPGEPKVIMVVGVNGVGKTTSIGKLAYNFRKQGKKVMLAAADTFRAAAIEQLEIWGERAGADVIKRESGADPSSVVYDAISAAVSRNTDILLIDTAGRLHTKTNLMNELAKIHRVTGKKLSGAPHEIWLTLDATTGQNAISQAETFNKALGITGIILTKLDGTAKGGIVVGISHQLGIPVKYIGIGEHTDDLKEFDPDAFVDAIFG